ncbi:MAG: ABC transporter ATP-binding protein [Culicoidibacterales bacterium]
MSQQLQVIKRLFTFIEKYRFRFILAILFVLAGTILNAVMPLMLGRAITEIQQNIKIAADGSISSTINFEYIFQLCLLVLSIVLIGQFAIYTSSMLMTAVIQNTMRDIRSTVVQKLNRLPVVYFDYHQQGDILARITNDIDAIGNALQQSFLTIITAVTGIIAAIVLLAIISVPIMLVAALIIPGSLLISKILMGKSQVYFDGLQDSLGKLNGFIQEDYSGFNIIKLYGREDISQQEFEAINHKLTDVAFKGSVLSAFIMPLSGFITNFVYLSIAVIGGYLTIIGSMTVGNLIAACQYVWQINNPVSQITQLAAVGQSSFAAMKRVIEILDEPEQVKEVEKVELSAITKGHVVFDNVSFSYAEDRELINNLSFEAKSGQTVAIVGPTGAGKTTIINLLLRFYEINGGAIKIDGVSIADMTREQLRSLFGMVLQDAWLYQTTISDNIRLGKLGAEEYEVVDSAKAANVHHFIKTLSSGYDTYLNEETSNVSEGQKQLLTIARAIISNPKILILDEATSSVDTRLEVLIQKAMKKLMAGRTSFVIAHRLSTIKEADLILVLKEGSIIEKGTHQELLTQKGFYEQLYNSQFTEEV